MDVLLGTMFYILVGILAAWAISITDPKVDPLTLGLLVLFYPLVAIAVIVFILVVMLGTIASKLARRVAP